MFLAMLVEESTMQPAAPTFEYNSTSIHDFIEGFVNATSLLTYIPDLKTCGHLEPSTKDAIENLINLAKSINETNWEEVVPQLLNATVPVFTQLLKEGKNCKRAFDESLELFGKVKLHVTRPGYLNDVITHATQTIFDLIIKFKNIQDAINSGNHREIGKHTGFLAVHLFFFDFKL